MVNLGKAQSSWPQLCYDKGYLPSLRSQILGRSMNRIYNYSLRLLTTAFLAGLFIIVLNSDLRSSVRSMLQPDYRVILAVANADFDGSGNKHKVVKVKTNEGIFLEVYSASGKKGSSLLEASTKLPDKKDGYFTFNGEVTNLAIDDIDNDKKLEILATTFDSDLVAHLNVYRFVPGDKDLELVHLH